MKPAERVPKARAHAAVAAETADPVGSACVVTCADVAPVIGFPCAALSPGQAMDTIPSASTVLVDARDMPGQIAIYLRHLAATDYRGVAVILTPFCHVPIWFRNRHQDVGSAEVRDAAERAAWAVGELAGDYLRRSGRTFAAVAFPDLIGVSPRVEQVRAILPKVAAHDRGTVLICGGSGTGKQVVARGIHDNGPRKAKPFVEVNCTALTDTLLESELFGRERGAYTDAHTMRRGLVEMAGDGTLFLDEIGHMSEKLQMSLLKVIEQRTFRRLGGDEERTSTARFLAATSRDLKSAMEEGAFRSDLYYRLNVLTVALPSLADRDVDPVLLAFHYAREYAGDYDMPLAGLTGEAALMLLDYEWPGNVRELKNVIERAVVFHQDQWLDADSLSLETRPKTRPAAFAVAGADPALLIDPSGAIKITIPPWGISLDAVERAVVEAALRATSFNVTRTAKLLFISRDTLRYRIKKYGLSMPHDEGEGG